MARLIFVTLIYILWCLPAFCSPDTFRATRRSNGIFKHSNAGFTTVKTKPQTLLQTTPDTTAAMQSECDTASYALYMNCVKQHGWMRGLGKPITDEHASHLPSYYRFSHKNSAGHWTKVENFNGYGQLSNNQMGTLLVNPFDDEDTNVDSQWREKLKQVVCWELVGDATGENCIQENAYDSNHNLIYSYIPVQIAPNRFMGHYVDAWGMPARFRDDDGAKYVVIQLDKNGYESEISFIGDDGFPQKNRWNSYMSKYTYDPDGFKLSERSCTVEGIHMRDRSGNSGQDLVNDIYGNAVLATNIDENGNYIRVDSGDDYIQSRSEFDKWGRETLHLFQLPDGTPDTTRYGVNGYELKYDDRGNRIQLTNIGLDGKPINCRPGWHSIIRQEFDRCGNNTLFELRDRDSLLWNNQSGYCMEVSEYDGPKLLTQKDFATTNGRDTVMIYQFYRDGNRRINVYYDRDEIDIFTDDDNGITITEEFYTLDGKPRNDEYRGYHRKVTDITRGNGKYREETSMYDKEGKYVSLGDSTFRKHITNTDSYLSNRFVAKQDTANLVVTREMYDGNNLLMRYQQPKSPDFQLTMGEIGLDIMGDRARTHFENALYYNVYTCSTIKGDFAYIGITNEYGEIAYAQSDDRFAPWTYAFSPLGDSGSALDENGNPIEDLTEFRKTLPLAYIIEVCDSTAAEMGIKSGDVIMKYGNWVYPEPIAGYEKGDQLREAMLAYHDIDKDMTVMRRNPETNTAEAHTIHMGKGKPGDYGFYVFSVPYTLKEAARYTACFNSSTMHDDVPALNYKPDAKSPYMSFFRPLRIQGHDRNIFGRGVHDDAVLLGVAVQDTLGNCSSAMYNTKASIDNWYSDGNTVKKIWFTTDLRTVQSLELRAPEQYWEAVLWPDYAPDSRLTKPCKALRRQTEKEMALYTDSLRSEHLNSMISRYGEAYRAVENDSISIVYTSVLFDEDKGYMAKHGYTGDFIVLEWCGWKCTDPINEFTAIFEKNRKKKKHVVLLPIGTDDEGNDSFGEAITIDCRDRILGLNIRDLYIDFPLFSEAIFSRYDEWRRKGGQ